MRVIRCRVSSHSFHPGLPAMPALLMKALWRRMNLVKYDNRDSGWVCIISSTNCLNPLLSLPPCHASFIPSPNNYWKIYAPGTNLDTGDKKKQKHCLLGVCILVVGECWLASTYIFCLLCPALCPKRLTPQPPTPHHLGGLWKEQENGSSQQETEGWKERGARHILPSSSC